MGWTADRLVYVAAPALYDARVTHRAALVGVVASWCVSLGCAAPLAPALSSPDRVAYDVCAVALARPHVALVSAFVYFLPALVVLVVTVAVLGLAFYAPAGAAGIPASRSDSQVRIN